MLGRFHREQFKMQGLGLNPNFSSYWLCELRQVTLFPWTLVFLTCKMEITIDLFLLWGRNKVMHLKRPVHCEVLSKCLFRGSVDNVC